MNHEKSWVLQGRERYGLIPWRRWRRLSVSTDPLGGAVLGWVAKSLNIRTNSERYRVVYR